MENKFFENLLKELAQVKDPSGEVVASCKYCEAPDSEHYHKDEEGHLKTDEFGTFFKKTCRGEREFLLERFVFNEELRSVQEDSPKFTPLINTTFVKNKKLIVKPALIHASYSNFLCHFKTFLYELFYNYNLKNFTFETMTIPKLRELKFGNVPGLKTFDDLHKFHLIIFNLGLETYENKMDLDNVSEFIEGRLRPTWFICQKESLSKNLSAPLKNKIKALEQINLVTGKTKDKTSTAPSTSSGKSRRSTAANKALGAYKND